MAGLVGLIEGLLCRRVRTDVFMTASELSARWKCSVSSIHRILGRHSVRRYVLGSGVNAMVRYLVEDIERIEAASIVDVGGEA